MISNLLYRSFFIDSWLIKCFLNCSVSFAQRTFKLSTCLDVLPPTFVISSSIYLLRKCALSAESQLDSLTSFKIFWTVPSQISFIALTSFITFFTILLISILVSLSLYILCSTSTLIISLILSVTWSCWLLNPSTSQRTLSAILATSALRLTSYQALASSSCLIHPFILLIWASKFD